MPRVGAVKAARTLVRATGPPVVAEDVHRLTEAGVLRSDGEFKGHPTYGAESLLALPAAVVEEAVTDRLRRAEATAEAAAQALRVRLAQSPSPAEAAEELGWSARRLALAEADPWR
ncbi:hypothetical protein [Kitasatospora sp. NPDC097691]|uniref:hypothetical protein n=1 Tax=Kitasatospora sp. NPDC097691 TaxID=3157231 RepID=UPI0033214205